MQGAPSLKRTKCLGNASGVPLSSAQTDTVLLYKGGQPQAILSPAWGAGGTWNRHKTFSGLVELPPAVDASLVFQVVPGAPRARLLVACKIQGVSYVALFIGLCSLHEDSAHTWVHCQTMFKKCQRFVGVPLQLDVQRSITKSHLPRFASIACGRANFAVTNRGVVHSWAGTQESWHVLPWFSLLPESLVDLSFGCLPFLAGVRPAFNFCSFILRIYFWHVLVVACHRLCQPSFD